MFKLHAASFALLLVTLAACAAGTRPLPTRTTPFPAPDQLLVWHGTGEASRLEGGTWKRAPEHDYELTVVQRRYGARWESTKEMHRRHPAYDGSAGPRDQTFHFSLTFGAPTADAQVPFAVQSTMGDGNGRVDTRFERATFRMRAQVSRFAPFDTYALTQHYRYDEGALDEVVRLVRSSSGQDEDWVRIEEHARMLAPSRFASPPTTLSSLEQRP